MNLSRRNVLRSTTALSLAAVLPSSCSSSDVTVQSILDAIKTTCGFATTAQAIIPVILTVISTFNAAAGAAATVAASVAQQVETLICGAVQQQAPKIAQDHGKPSAAEPLAVTIVVNGVNVPGTLIR